MAEESAPFFPSIAEPAANSGVLALAANSNKWSRCASVPIIQPSVSGMTTKDAGSSLQHPHARASASFLTLRIAALLDVHLNFGLARFRPHRVRCRSGGAEKEFHMSNKAREKANPPAKDSLHPTVTPSFSSSISPRAIVPKQAIETADTC